MRKNAEMYFHQQQYWQSANPDYTLQQWEILQMLSFISLSHRADVDFIDEGFEMELFMGYINDEFPVIELKDERNKEDLMELILHFTKKYIDG